MATASDLQLFIRTSLDGLSSLANGLPSGAKAQVEELAATLHVYDTTVDTITHDPKLSPEGKRIEAHTAAQAAQADIEKWRSRRIEGLDRQLTAMQSSLLAKSDASLPTPSDLRIQMLAQQLVTLDPLQVNVLYQSADPATQVAMEKAHEAIGQQPVTSEGKLTWRWLLNPDSIAAVALARAERVDPQGAQSLHDLQRLRNSYAGLSAQVVQLIKASLASHETPAHAV